jgi:hypothetical protein
VAVILGYAGALGAAAVVMLASSRFADPASSGMSALGDAILAGGIFALGCLPPTAVALWQLPKQERLWRVVGVGLVCWALSGPVVMLAFPGPLAAIRALAGLLFAVIDAVAAVCTPPGRNRRTFIVAAVTEVLGAALGLLLSLG